MNESHAQAANPDSDLTEEERDASTATSTAPEQMTANQGFC